MESANTGHNLKEKTMEYLGIGTRVYPYPDKPTSLEVPIRSVSEFTKVSHYGASRKLHPRGYRRILEPRGNYVLFGDL